MRNFDAFRRYSRPIDRFFAGLLMLAATVAILPFAHAAPPHQGKHKNHQHADHDHGRPPVTFSIRSVRDGRWSAAATWKPARVPRDGDRVLISRGTDVAYDVKSEAKIRMVQIVGALRFARDRDTLLNVGIIKVQNSDQCSESGFACDFRNVNSSGEPQDVAAGARPVLEIGTPDRPIPAEHTARIRLHFFEGMNKNDAPAIACCTARMDIHGAPMSRTWIDLGKTASAGESEVVLSQSVTGWRVGDDVIITGSKHHSSFGGNNRENPSRLDTESRQIMAVRGLVITLDRPLVRTHLGDGEFRSEIANLSRNVIIESADPKGVRGHTIYHAFSQGSISYARFAHLGKEGVLGRYPIHFHLVEDSMRGSSVVGVAIVDSHNRWVTVHGTDYLLVRDCVGYRSVGHGFFLEDGSEVYTVFDRNLGVQAYEGRRLPDQVLPFDPNDGAAFWWANGRNTFTRNTTCENDQYGFRYDSQKRSNFDSELMVRMPNGEIDVVDIRKLPFYRFEDNEAHSEGLYGMAIAGTDRTGPDVRHPHILRNLKIWQVHYALRVQVPTMLIENVNIDHAAYGIYRPEFENHVYRKIRIAHTNTEPFNRGLDDRSTQYGPITVDGLTFVGTRHGGLPMIQMSDNNPTGRAESHFRNVKVIERQDNNRRALVDRGGGARVEPTTPTSVPVYFHDYFGSGRHAKIVSTHSRDFSPKDSAFRKEDLLTGKESRAKEVRNVDFLELLTPIDDLPPTTIIQWPAAGHTARLDGGMLAVRGTTSDNVKVTRVLVNGVEAKSVDYNFAKWEVVLTGVKPGTLKLVAVAEDDSGNIEKDVHRLKVAVQ